MNEELKDIFFYSLTFRDIFNHLVVALICGLLISVLYRMTYRGLSYSTTFVNTLILLTMITAVVIMVIGNNLATAFGLVGAMSIIRFRTAVKDSQDIMFIFFSLAIGLACGVGLFSVAILGTLGIGSVFYIIVRANLSAPRKRDFLLQLLIKGSENDTVEVGKVISRFCRSHKVINIKAIGEDNHDMLEVSYYIRFKNEEKSQNMMREIKQLEGVQHANLFFDEE
ncbi:MAG: DUF4956 domain-containing protein [Cytophagaceae bacterium]